MKKTFLPLFVVLFLLAFSASAQVKQVFKVIAYPDGKPLAGATLTLYGNSIKTNAKGVAVANLPESCKGDYLATGDWTLEGYLDLGSPTAVGTGDFQGKDTSYVLMVRESDYRESLTDLFVRYLRREYNSEVKQMLAYVDSARLHPENSNSYSQELMVYSAHILTTAIRSLYKDAQRTSPYTLSRMNEAVRAAAEPFLQKGAVDSATLAVKALVKPNDVSRENLEIIANYVWFKDLSLSMPDDEPSSNYSRILYQNQYSAYSIGDHLINLLSEGNWEEADSITAKEQEKDKIPHYSFLFEPSIMKYANGQDELYAAALQKYINRCEKSCSKYPSQSTYWMLIENRRMMLTPLYYIGDTVRLNLQWDSLLSACQQYFDMETNGDFYKNKCRIEIYMNILERVHLGMSSYSDAKIRELGTAVYHAAKENYTRYPSDVFLQLQYAVMNNEYIVLLNSQEGDSALLADLLHDQMAIGEVLLKSFPEMFSVNQLVTNSQIFARAVYGLGTDEEVLRAFRDFKRSFTLLDSIYHGVFTSTTLDYCAYAANYLRDQNRTAAVAEMDAFIELLLAMHAAENSRPLESEKAMFYNHQAESYYQNKSYSIALQMYDSAAEYFAKAVEKDPELWIPYMRNYLQKGDAYLGIDEYGKAREVYRKVLEYEPRIPPELKGQYYHIKGEVFYYDGDVYTLFKDKKNADKMYKLAEKYFKQAVGLGDSTACFSLGEMYLLQGVHNYKKGGEKKLVSMVEKAARTYEMCPMDQPYQRYLQAVTFLENYYKEREDSVRYVRELKALAEFSHRFAAADTSYLSGCIYYSNKLATGLGVTKEAVKYSEYEVDAYRWSFEMGNEQDLSYLQALYRLANQYTEIGAYEKTFELYEECLRLNERMFKDTATADYALNAYRVYSAMIDNYTNVAEKCEGNGDDKESIKWYEKAVRASDTMILIAEKYMEFTDSAYKNYSIASMFYQNALICKALDWKSIAISQIDSANAYLLKLYGGEYWSEVETELIRNLYQKGGLATDSHDLEFAKECYKELVDYASKSDWLYDKTQNGPNMAAIYYYGAVEAWLDILENREEGADKETIESLKKQQDALAKILKGKKK